MLLTGIMLLEHCVAFGSAPILRRQSIEKAAKRGEIVIAALDGYYESKGSYPDKLNQLVPDHLDSLPYTGLPGHPFFRYKKGTGEPVKDYELYINCPLGFLNFDWFFYWPEQNYPDRIYGNRVETIGDWAYVHE